MDRNDNDPSFDRERIEITLEVRPSDQIKNQILGLNAARLFGVDVKESRKAIKADKLTKAREKYRRDPSPSNTQYGWVWVDDGREPTVPVGN